MNVLSPRFPKRRRITPLMWAGIGTLLFHSAFFLLLWLWPRPPAKARETLLEVNLTKDKPLKVEPRPTPVPTKVAKPTPRPKVKIRPVVTKPKVVIKPRVATKVPLRATPIPTVKAPIVLPTKVPLLNPTPKTQPTSRPEPTPKTKPTPVVEPTPKTKPTPLPEPTPKTKPTPVTEPTKVPKTETAGKPAVDDARQRTRRSRRESANPGANSGSPSKPKTNSNEQTPAPSSGGSNRRYAANPEQNDGLGGDERRPGAPESARSGSNSRGRSDETAGDQSGLTLPPTRSRRGRKAPLDGSASSAPTSSKDGTEVNIGPSSPSSNRGGSRREAPGNGNGEDPSGPARRSGRPGATGSTSAGNSRSGRGADEAAGDGVTGGANGSGSRAGARRGRGGSRLAGDPYGGNGNGNGNGTGNGNGNGGDDGNGTGNGPKGGTRLARRDGGRGGSGGDGNGQFGRGNGTGNGSGQGQGNGNGTQGRGTTGDGGRGGADRADNDGAESGTGRARSRRGRGGQRTGEGEDQIGRGIWGGFKIRFYQDKSDHPDLPDATFHPGNPIDWPLFTQLKAQKTVPNLDFDWGETPPAPGMKSTFWSMKATGRIFVPKDDTYEFFFDELDDAGSLILDGKTIINVSIVQKSSPSSGKISLTRGAHDIQIEYIQGPATAASIKLSWKSTSFPREIVGVYQAPTTP